MTLYLVFGETDGFGNDAFLSGVFRTVEEARKRLMDTPYYSRYIRDLKEDLISFYCQVQEVEDLLDIESAGIYKIEI